MSAPTLAQLQVGFKQYLFSGANEAVFADQIVGGNNIHATRRLDVYRNAYYIRLQEALAHDFPVLLALMGEAAFGREMAAYLKACPSTSPSLRYIGRQLPDYLANRNKPQLADLARLEWAVLKAFDAGDACVLSMDDMQHILPDAWQELHFELHPSVSVLEPVNYVFTVWNAHRRNQPLPDRGTEAITPLLVWRNQEGPVAKVLSNECHSLITSLGARLSFAQACEQLAAVIPSGDVAQITARCLMGLIHDGCFAKIRRVPFVAYRGQRFPL